MGRLPAILVGQIPVVTTTDRGKRGKRTEDRGQRASRPEYGIENLSKFLGIVLPLGEKKKKGRKKKRKRKTTTLDRAATFFFSSPPPLSAKKTRLLESGLAAKIILEESVPIRNQQHLSSDHITAL